MKVMELIERLESAGRRAVVLNDREIGHVLAGLRMLDHFRQSIPSPIHQIQTEAGAPMTSAEIDALCERINLGTRVPARGVRI